MLDFSWPLKGDILLDVGHVRQRTKQEGGDDILVEVSLEFILGCEQQI